jgi:hypothetical protein
MKWGSLVGDLLLPAFPRFLRNNGGRKNRGQNKGGSGTTASDTARVWVHVD